MNVGFSLELRVNLSEFIVLEFSDKFRFIRCIRMFLLQHPKIRKPPTLHSRQDFWRTLYSTYTLLLTNYFVYLLLCCLRCGWMISAGVYCNISLNIRFWWP